MTIRFALSRRFARVALLPAALLALLGWPMTSLSAQAHHAHDSDDIGNVNFRVGCSDAVRQEFDRALAMLHHMMYVQARGQFRDIAERDPQCGMAHWGVAMTSFQPLWQRPSANDLRTGWAALERARETGIRGEREQALVTATAAFFRNPDADEWFGRLDRWAAAMEEAHRAHPQDDDIAAFHALAQIAAGQNPARERLAQNARAARLLLAVHERNAGHPGALHYTIHANDISSRESESLDMVRAYDEVAPSVPHALHMPTHIFVRLGEWPEVLEWNRKSADAALRFPADDRTSMHHIHALDYMLYAHLQRGEDAEARKVLDEAFSRGRYEENLAAAFHLAVMPARYAIERRAWEEAAKLTPRDPDYVDWNRFTWPEALSWFARGMGAAHVGDLATAREAEAQMRTIAERARTAGTTDLATYIEVDRLILAGTIARSENPDSALARMRAAAELDATVQKHPVTPGALLPPYEAMGDLLMSLDRPAEALAAYERGLAVWPSRYRSVLGAARAARATGETEKARRHYASLLEITGKDARRPGLEEARSFVAQR